MIPIGKVVFIFLLHRCFIMKIENKYKELYLDWKKTGSKESLKKLMDVLYPTIEKGIKTFGGGLPSLYGKAKLIAYDALNSYSPDKGTLDSHLMLNLQRLYRYAPQSGAILDVPELVRMQAKQLETISKELEEKFRRPVSDQELADYMGLSLRRIQKIRSAQGTVPESIFEGSTPAKALVDVDDKQKAKRELWMETLYKEVSPVQQYIMDHKFGLHGHKPKTLEEIAQKLKLSVSTVHKYLREIDEKLDLINKV